MHSKTSPHQEIESLLLKAEDNALFRARPDEALEFARRAATEARKAKDAHSLARSKMMLAVRALDDCAYDRALTLSLEARRTFEVVGDAARSAEALDYIGKAHMLLGQYAPGIEAFCRAIQSCGDGEEIRKGILQYDLSTLHRRKGDLVSSAAYSLRSLRTLENADQRVLSFVLYNIGNILSINRRDTSAGTYFERAAQRVKLDLERDENELAVGASPFDLQLLADIYSQSGNYNEARKYYRRAYPQFRQFGYYVTEAECLIELGRLCVKLGLVEESSSYFSEAAKIATKLDNRSLRASTQLAQAEYLIATDRFPEAESQLLRCLTYSKASGNCAIELTAYEHLAALEASRKNLSRSASYYREANDLLRGEYLSVNRLAEPDESTKIYSTGGVFSGSLEDVIRWKNDRIHELESDLTERNSLLVTLRNKLGALLALTGDQQARQLRQILGAIDEHMQFLTNEKTVRSDVEQLNEDFIARLSLHCPELTATQLYICSLLALGFHNREIEDVLKISARTLENQRFRIRRKMNLKRTEKLEFALRKFRAQPAAA